MADETIIDLDLEPDSRHLRDPRAVAKYLEAKSLGANDEHSARAAGWNPRTVRVWKQLDAQHREEERETLFTRFFDQVQEAITGHVLFHLQSLRRSAESGNAKASMWTLERSGYQTPKQPVSVDLNVRSWATMMLDDPDDDDLEDLVEEKPE